MFNGKKLKELERRIELLEENVGWNYTIWEQDLNLVLAIRPLCGNADPRYMLPPNDGKVPVRTVIRDLLRHFKLEYKTTPETTRLVAKE